MKASWILNFLCLNLWSSEWLNILLNILCVKPNLKKLWFQRTCSKLQTGKKTQKQKNKERKSEWSKEILNLTAKVRTLWSCCDGLLSHWSDKALPCVSCFNTNHRLTDLHVYKWTLSLMWPAMDYLHLYLFVKALRTPGLSINRLQSYCEVHEGNSCAAQDLLYTKKIGIVASCISFSTGVVWPWQEICMLNLILFFTFLKDGR